MNSSWKKGYSVRGIRKTVTQYSKLAGMSRSLSPHKLRHFLFTWMKKQGIDDALIQPYLGHQTRQSLEVYSKLSIRGFQSEGSTIGIPHIFRRKVIKLANRLIQEIFLIFLFLKHQTNPCHVEYNKHMNNM